MRKYLSECNLMVPFKVFRAVNLTIWISHDYSIDNILLSPVKENRTQLALQWLSYGQKRMPKYGHLRLI